MEYLEYPKMLYPPDGGYVIVDDAVAEKAQRAGWGTTDGGTTDGGTADDMLGTDTTEPAKRKIQRRPASVETQDGL